MRMYKKHINIYRAVLCTVFMMLMIIVLNTEMVYAASATVSISSSEVTKGEEFNVIIRIKADTNIGAYNFYVDYDAEILEAVSGFEGGGNGRVQVMYYIQSAADAKTDITVKIKFKAKKPGTSSIKYVSISDDNGVIDFDSADNMSVTATEGSVKVKAPYVASTDNYLTNLKVEAVKSDGSTYTLNLSPKFSKDVTKYNAKAVEGVTKLVVTADKSDSKASITMSGRNMDPGDNTTTITVTAEDGSVRKYVIYTNVEKKPETTTPPPEPIKIQIDGTDAFLKDIDKSVKLPEGFEKVNYQYKGEEVIVGKGLVKNLIVMCVTKGENDDGQLYIYDETADIFYPMSNIQLTQKLYTIVKEPQDLIIPSGYKETTVTIDEQTFKGWSNSEIENVYLIYAMNWNGEKGLYYYDSKEKQIIRYFDVTVQVGAGNGIQIDDYNDLVSQNENLKDEINRLKKENNNSEAESVKLYKYLSAGCCIMAVIYLGIIIYLVAVKKNKQSEEIEDTEKIENEEDIQDAGEEITEEIQDDIKVSEDNAAEEKTENEKTENEKTEHKMAANDKIGNDKAIEANQTIDKEDNNSVQNDIVVTVTENPIDEALLLDDEQDEIDDLLMDFEDIITAETVASIMEEEENIKASNEDKEDKDVTNEIKVELAKELVPEVPASEALEEENDKIEEAITDDSDIAASIDETMVEDEKKDSGEKQKKNNEMTTSEDIDDEKKKKVAKIMEDDDSSINSDDIDMVIDELFDDLFD